MQINSADFQNLRKSVFFYSLLALLISIPLNYAFSTTSMVVFVLLNILFGAKSATKTLNLSYLILIALYLFGAISFFWSVNTELTLTAIVRELPLLLIPVALLFSPKLDKPRFFEIWRLMSFF